MLINQLKINDNKTEIVIIGSRQQLSKLPDIHIKIGSINVQPIDTVTNLGVTLDSKMTMNNHINRVCRNANYQLIKIRQLRQYLTKHSTETIVHAFITSTLDYCNSIYYNLPNKQLNKLQKIQNHSARIITKKRKYDHITPVLKSLHWLPIKQRIIFKVAILTFKTLNGLAPNY